MHTLAVEESGQIHLYNEMPLKITLCTIFYCVCACVIRVLLVGPVWEGGWGGLGVKSFGRVGVRLGRYILFSHIYLLLIFLSAYVINSPFSFILF